MKRPSLILACSALATLMLPSMASAQEYDFNLDVARYFRADGSILGEHPIAPHNTFISFSPLDWSDPSLGYRVLSHFLDEDFERVTFIPAGSVPHDLEVVSCPEETTVTLEVLGETPARMLRSGDANGLVSGTLVKITVDLPEGLIPEIRVDMGYANNTETEVFKPLTAKMGLGAHWWKVMSTALPEAREQWLAQLLDRPLPADPDMVCWCWTKESTGTNRWSIIAQMPNANTDLSIEYVCALDENGNKTDVPLKQGELPDLICHNALRQTCRQYYIAINSYFNGELSIANMSDVLAGDAYINLWASWGALNTDLLFRGNNNINDVPWTYSLHLIDSANIGMRFAPEANNTESMATMRMLRALGYLHLLQYMAPRWQDSNNGSIPCAPLYSELGTLDSPLASMSEVIDFCRADLEYAIENLSQQADFGQPTCWTARGLLVRLSLLCHDWQRAHDNAAEILEVFPLTSNADMTAGFFRRTDSWIWGLSSSDPSETLYYQSMQSWMAINGTYPLQWNMGTSNGAMDRNLFKTAWSNSADDIRLRQFAMPEVDSRISKVWKKFDPNTMLQASLLFRGWIHSCAPEGYDMQYNNFEDKIASTKYQLGQQAKFWANTSGECDGGDGCVMRSDEMLLAQAEAALMLGNNAEATELISRLAGLREALGAGGVPTETSELFEYIRLQRRIELWGEGHAWTDTKRWNQRVVRQAWDPADSNSGNWPKQYAFTTEPDEANGWRHVIPDAALRSNPSIDINSLGYTQYVTGLTQEAPAKATAVMPSTSPALYTEPSLMIDKYQAIGR